MKVENLRVKIDDIPFTIKEIIVKKEYLHNTNYNVNSTISILAEISNRHYIQLSNWFDKIQTMTNYKKSIDFNTIKIHGIFPVDYNFSQYCINVTFSADYIDGDLKLFERQQLRKEKLKKIACQKYSY